MGRLKLRLPPEKTLVVNLVTGQKGFYVSEVPNIASGVMAVPGMELLPEMAIEASSVCDPWPG